MPAVMDHGVLRCRAVMGVDGLRMTAALAGLVECELSRLVPVGTLTAYQYSTCQPVDKDLV